MGISGIHTVALHARKHITRRQNAAMQQRALDRIYQKY
jgi:hypothetical protein